MPISGIAGCGYPVEILAKSLSTKVLGTSKRMEFFLKVFRHEYRFILTRSGFFYDSSRKTTTSRLLDELAGTEIWPQTLQLQYSPSC